MKLYRLRITSWKMLFIVLTLSVQFTACYSPIEGCIDPESTNYNITADDMCDDCCEYPGLELRIFHEQLDTTFNLLDTITNDLGQSISLVDFVYLLSDFTVETVGDNARIQEQVTLSVGDATESVTDDVIRVDRDRFSFDMGTIIFAGNTESISFKVGLIDVLNENRFASEIEGHPLTTDPDSLFQADSDTYVFQRLKVAQGIDFLDTVIYDIDHAVDVKISIIYVSIRGEDKVISIEAQYDQWFTGVDFESMSKEEIEAKIAENTSTIFRKEG